jgi:hypothetical protein
MPDSPGYEKDISSERFLQIPSIFSGCGGKPTTNDSSEKNGRESGKYALFLAKAAVHAGKHAFSHFPIPSSSSSFLSTLKVLAQLFRSVSGRAVPILTCCRSSDEDIPVRYAPPESLDTTDIIAGETTQRHSTKESLQARCFRLWKCSGRCNDWLLFDMEERRRNAEKQARNIGIARRRRSAGTTRKKSIPALYAWMRSLIVLHTAVENDCDW